MSVWIQECRSNVIEKLIPAVACLFVFDAGSQLSDACIGNTGVLGGILGTVTLTSNAGACLRSDLSHQAVMISRVCHQYM